ncbi:TetR/AcrR family transcriptional regulator [Companilactobacillus furfuricola]|uniref:TetR/AcrR family transcriptional regulator n=1 Tax=Companilactobacillus furfuricola TaxID=1462575 RepID=UPI000F76E991|nr:TetR/AcrR family transcriptional regulator [Companilactobacillus furfuricola]
MDDKRDRIFDAAHVLFLERGFRNTSVADITSIAGISVGTFYLYFKSKEELFVEIYNSENVNVKAEILSKVDLDDDPVKVIRLIVDQIFKLSSNNQILNEWFNNPKLNALIASQNKYAVEGSLIYSTMLRLIDKWIDADLVKPGMSKTRIVSLFDALTVLDFHQKELKTDNYQQVLDDMIEGILKVILK